MIDVPQRYQDNIQIILILIFNFYVLYRQLMKFLPVVHSNSTRQLGKSLNSLTVCLLKQSYCLCCDFHIFHIKTSQIIPSIFGITRWTIPYWHLLSTIPSYQKNVFTYINITVLLNHFRCSISFVALLANSFWRALVNMNNVNIILLKKCLTWLWNFEGSDKHARTFFLIISVQTQQKKQVARTGVFEQEKVYAKLEKKNILRFAWLETILL